MENPLTTQTSHLQPDSLLPARGLIPLQNRRGKPYQTLDILRWLHLSRLVFKTDKVDLLADARGLARAQEVFAAFASTADSTDAPVSLRVPAHAPVPDLAPFKERGLWDLLLCCDVNSHDAIRPWLEHARQLGLPVRLQVNVPSLYGVTGLVHAETSVEHLQQAPVTAVSIVINDPFWKPRTCGRGSAREQCITAIARLTQRLHEAGMAVSIVGAPFCMFDQALWPHIENSRQFFAEPQHYNREAYEFALRLHTKSPLLAGKIVKLRAQEGVTYDNPLERRLLDWLFSKHPVRYGQVLLLRTLLRRRSTTPLPPQAMAHTPQKDFGTRRGRNPRCATCSLQLICDQDTPRVLKAFPDLQVQPVSGPVQHDPMLFARRRIHHLDALDKARAAWPQHLAALTAQAAHRVANEAPTEIYGFDSYRALNTFTKPLPGAVRWFSLQSGEKVSTVLEEAAAPFTMAITFGGGMADLIGFSLGRHIRVLCPMIAPSHRLVLHVDADGAYVLLRDGVPVRPIEIPGRFYAPRKLPTLLRPAISIWNVEGSLFTQNLTVWRSPKEQPTRGDGRQFSVIIVSTRFSRRLQAVLRCLAHQRYDRDAFEIIVGYVPGIDATDDTINSAERTYPGLRLVRSPLPERYVRTKGVAINHALDLARGKWHLLLDSDILLPPDFFQRVDAVDGTPSFVGPDRRKMLPPDVTGAVLMGERNPWDEWDSLLDGPGELRIREGGHLPVGYCQCIRAACTERVRYKELDHFEGADWDFITEVEQVCGAGHILEDFAVLHLDHGGSQWYGTAQHL
jgi:hypothetical protein